MRKSTFFWRELFHISPLAVERCACVWMINGAREQIKNDLGTKFEAGCYISAPGIDTPEFLGAAGPVEMIMAQLDVKHQHERRLVLMTLLVSGLGLTIQPWLSLNFFSLPLILAGAMLLGLEFSPRNGLGIIGTVKRFKKNADTR